MLIVSEDISVISHIRTVTAPVYSSDLDESRRWDGQQKRYGLQDTARREKPQTRPDWGIKGVA